jgi:hypothetical protein
LHLNFASTINVEFAVNGGEDIALTNGITLEGSAFSIPLDHKKAADHSDIAWINIRDYYYRKMAEGADLDWTLDDLPKEHFYTCNISKEPGLLKGDYQICGRLNCLGFLYILTFIINFLILSRFYCRMENIF